MKYTITVVVIILQLVTGRPQNNNDSNTKITSYENVNDGEGNFKIAFQADNGITQQQVSELKIINSTTTVTVMRGFFSTTAPNNRKRQVVYSADENGFHYRFSIAASSLDPVTTTNIFKKGQINVPRIAAAEEQKENNNSLLPQPVLKPSTLPVNNTTSNNTDASKEFPDRIGTPAIITLTGPPG